MATTKFANSPISPTLFDKDNAAIEKLFTDPVTEAIAPEKTPAVNEVIEAEATTPVLTFTTEAAARVQRLIAEDEDDELGPDTKLRLAIAGGGCSGFKYEFSFTDTQEDDDEAITTDDVTLLVDPTSLQYLEGATIGFEEDANGEQFVIKNPQAQTTCGCGSSFSA